MGICDLAGESDTSVSFKDLGDGIKVIITWMAWEGFSWPVLMSMMMATSLFAAMRSGLPARVADVPCRRKAFWSSTETT